MTTTERKGQNMRHEETRDNTTAIENQIREADAHEDTRDVWAGTDIYIDEGEADTRETPTKLVNDADTHELGIYRPGTWRGRMLRQAKAMFGPIRSSEPDPAGVQLETDPVKVAEIHDGIVAKARQASEERFEEINDGANGYDEDEPEDDGQPSEYDEWQDYMGGDEYYDHSENEMW